MKECGILQIITNSIKRFLEDSFVKKIDDILISDLLLVESLTINGRNYDGERETISFQDLNNFKNLKYLEVANTLITNSAINIFAHCNYLEKIIFRNCTFSKQITSLEALTNIKGISIYKCKKFNISFIKDILNIKRVFISGVSIPNVETFIGISLCSLDISGAIVTNFNHLEELSLNNLIISDEQYSSNKEKILECNYKIMIMASDGYYIKKWIN